MTGPEDLRAVWDRANGVQRERWREHVDEFLPDALLETLTAGPDEEPAD